MCVPKLALWLNHTLQLSLPRLFPFWSLTLSKRHWEQTNAEKPFKVCLYSCFFLETHDWIALLMVNSQQAWCLHISITRVFAEPWSPARKGFCSRQKLISGFQSKEMFKGLEMSCNTLAVTYPFQNEVWKQVVRVPPTGSPVYVVEYISSAKCQIRYFQIGVIMNKGNKKLIYKNLFAMLPGRRERSAIYGRSAVLYHLILAETSQH